MTLEKLQALVATGDLTGDLILQMTQETRRAMLTEMLSTGIPTGKDTYRTMQLLTDMDSTALNVKKIDTEDAAADNDRKAALLISTMNGQLGGVNPFKQVGGITTPGQMPAVDHSTIPLIVPLLEEDAVGISTLTYDEFTSPT